MNSVQVPTTASTAVAFIAGILAGKGVFGFDTPTWVTILTGAFGFIATIVTAIQTRKSALTTTVANLPEVKSISLDPTVPGATELNAVTPSNVKVTP